MNSWRGWRGRLALALAVLIAGSLVAKTRTLADLDERLLDYKPGARVRVDVLRDGKQEQFVVKLGSLSSGPT